MVQMLGILAACILFGCAMTTTGFYYSRCHRDRLAFKGLVRLLYHIYISSYLTRYYQVAIVCLLDILDTSLICYLLYYQFITNLGTLDGLSTC